MPMHGQMFAVTHLEDRNERCLGMWSRGSGPLDAKVVRLRVGRTVHVSAELVDALLLNR